MKTGIKKQLARLVLGLSASLPLAQGAAAIQPLTMIGKGEGVLNVVAWEGYPSGEDRSVIADLRLALTGVR